MTVIRESVTVVDDRGKGDTGKLQLSNFHIVEDRETQDIEIYLTRLPGSKAGRRRAAVYRYIFTPE